MIDQKWNNFGYLSTKSRLKGNDRGEHCKHYLLESSPRDIAIEDWKCYVVQKISHLQSSHLVKLQTFLVFFIPTSYKVNFGHLFPVIITILMYFFQRKEVNKCDANHT